ncbi:hypothetical protein EK21DRAFT_88786 [Setomelanomma holmii]|uniref:Uncharacterized protein n=1 Tax=Setomelanomma holmii TaxID=210430 RepID=A0A9P4LPB6_9PLEO|nr:hypothetical protein EK21DRAFT_88786 [Setomelanomma holmii]
MLIVLPGPAPTSQLRPSVLKHVFVASKTYDERDFHNWGYPISSICHDQSDFSSLIYPLLSIPELKDIVKKALYSKITTSVALVSDVRRALLPPPEVRRHVQIQGHGNGTIYDNFEMHLLDKLMICGSKDYIVERYERYERYCYRIDRTKTYVEKWPVSGKGDQVQYKKKAVSIQVR